METLIPPVMRKLFADPPLVRGEDEADYHRMVGELGAESGATGVVDWMLVKDIADLTWQIARTRRFVSAYTVSAERVGLAAAFQQAVGQGTKYVYDKALAHADAALDAPDAGAGTSKALIARCGVPAAHLGIAHAFFRNLGDLMARSSLRGSGGRSAALVDGFAGAERIALLLRLDRYERRAYAKKHKALRLLAALARPQVVAPRTQVPIAS